MWLVFILLLLLSFRSGPVRRWCNLPVALAFLPSLRAPASFSVPQGGAALFMLPMDRVNTASNTSKGHAVSLVPAASRLQPQYFLPRVLPLAFTWVCYYMMIPGHLDIVSLVFILDNQWFTSCSFLLWHENWRWIGKVEISSSFLFRAGIKF